MTYLIAGGAVLGGLAGWGLRRPWAGRWLLGQADAYSRRACGLGLRAERLEIHPLEGRIRLHHLEVGGDLFQASLLEIDLEWATLLRSPHIRALVLVDPVVNLDPDRLAILKLKPRPEHGSTPLVWLDQLELRNGVAHVREPAWGIPQGDFQFQATGKGWSANQQWLDLRVPGIHLGPSQGSLQGDLALVANTTGHRLDLDQGHLRLGRNVLAFKGGYRYASRLLSVAGTGRLDLAQAQLLANPGAGGPGSGQLGFRAEAEGPLDRLAWSGTIEGKDLRARGLPLRPGTLQAAARGTPAGIRLERLTWASQDGRLEASGDWSPRQGFRVHAAADAVPLAPLAGHTRTGFLERLTARCSVDAKLPPPSGMSRSAKAPAPWALPRLDQMTVEATGQFIQDGQQVGSMALALVRSRLRTATVDLDLPELELHGNASGAFGRQGVAAIEAQAGVVTDAREVAGVLRAWDIGMDDDAGRLTALDMEGRATARARFSWEPRGGIRLASQVEVEAPRWHGARADQLRADVTIDRDELRVSDIQLDKGGGQGYGDLWLTWGDRPPGADQIDMCYRACRLPIRDGLRAADEGDLALDGSGSGWARLHGPFKRMLMEGQAVAEGSSAFGLRIPAASADFFMDIPTGRIQVTDVRIADTLAHLRPAPETPPGPLALRGSMDLDSGRETWSVALRGDLDSAILGLKGPDFQAQVDTHLDGPLVAPLGPMRMPTGSLAFAQGTVTLGDQRLEGLGGSVTFTKGSLKGQLGLAGKNMPLLRLEAAQTQPGRMQGSLKVELGPESADTARLCSSLTQDFLKDAHLSLQAQGDWSAQGFQWHGQMDRFSGKFEGFSLVQSRPGQVSGDTAGMELALEMEGVAAASEDDSAAGKAPKKPSIPGRGVASSATSMTLHGRLPFSPGSPLALELAGSSNLANLKTILDRLVQPGQYSLLADMHPEGSALFDLSLGGSFRDTTLDGTLTLTGGRVVVHSYPLSVENLDFTAQFKGRDIIIPKSAPLRGTLAQGALTAWGNLTWRPGGISSYDLHASVEDFQLRDLPAGFELQGSLDANLKGSDQDGGMLSGSIWANRTFYRTEINLSDLILANSLGAVGGLAGLDPSDPLARIDLDLEVHLAEPWELDTNLLKLQGRPKGPFSIRGNLLQPGLVGKMELLPGGRMTNLFPAGDIVLERGTIEFPDPAYFNPSLDVQGEIDIPPYLVTLSITGTLDALQAKPFSTPSLRQDEIFAILIDPAAVTTVGGAPGSSSQATMTTGLAGTSTGLITTLALASFQEQLRKTLNLDRVSVALRAGIGAPETSVTVGKSIDLFGYRTPLVFTHDKVGEVTTLSGQVEWRFGNYVFRLGATQITSEGMSPSGEIRHSWSPK